MEEIKEEEKKISLTSFYYSSQTLRLYLRQLSNWNEVYEAPGNNEEEHKDESNTEGLFIGSQPSDTPYSYMKYLEDHRVVLAPLWTNHYHSDSSVLQELLLKKRPAVFLIRQEEVSVSTKSEVVVSWVFKGESVTKVASDHSLSQQQIKNIIYEFKTLNRITHKVHKRFSMKRNKLKLRHIEFLKEFVEGRWIRGFSVLEAKLHLEKDFPTLLGISHSTVNRVLHKKLGLSYKKLGWTNVKKMSPESVSNLAACIKLMISLLMKKFYMMLIDELTINRKTLNTYGWTRRGQPGRLLIRTLEFKMSFVVAQSQIRIYGIIGTKDSFNQMKYKIFLQELLTKFKKNPKVDLNNLIFVADNWVFHKTKLIKDYVKHQKLKFLFIPSFSPEANA